MEKRLLGNTGLAVTPLGFGAGQIGVLHTPRPESCRLLNVVLDSGVNLIDTAACYGDSEEKIGEFISHRRNEYVLVTKCGSHVDDDDPPEWTAENVRCSIERSLRRMRTDRVDVLLLHSCTEQHLGNEEMLNALQKCKSDGKARFIGYSGDDAALLGAVDVAAFDCIMTSVNMCDQQVIGMALPRAAARGLGVIAKRPIANSCWRDMSDYGGPYGSYVQPYQQRLKKMGFTPGSLGFDGDWVELALRFTIGQDGLHVALVGGRNPDHVRKNVELIAKGPLPDKTVQAVRDAWESCDDGSWKGQI